MILLAVNHHYVVEEPPQAPRAIFPTTVAELERELALLRGVFEFVSRDDVLAAVRGDSPLPERACAITFDDGLRCQFEVALPVLDRLGVPGIFFACGMPADTGRAASVHKIHALRERLGDPELLEWLGDADVDPARASAMYSYDEPVAACVKYALNVVLPWEQRDALVDEIFTATLGSEQEFVDRLYMDDEQLRELAVRHALGAHGYSHRPLARLDDVELAEELAWSESFLGDDVGVARTVALSYPYGTPDAVDTRAARAAAAHGFEFAFTMEPALNRSLDQPLLLARIDVNDAPGGRHAKLEIVEGDLRLLGGVNPARTRYMSESGR